MIIRIRKYCYIVESPSTTGAAKNKSSLENNKMYRYKRLRPIGKFMIYIYHCRHKRFNDKLKRKWKLKILKNSFSRSKLEQR